MTAIDPRQLADARTTRSFLIIWSGQALSLLGSQLVQFGLIWYLARETGSATVLALASFVGLLPTVILGPIAGTLIDRWNRRRVMIAADATVAVATALLIWLFASELIAVWHIYAVLIVRAIGGAFHRPAMTASTSLMVPEKHLTRIAGVNQMINGGLNIISAPLGALLVETLPMHNILAIDVGTALIAILPLLFIHVPQPLRPVTDDGLAPSLPAEFREGFLTIWRWRGLRKLVFVALLINFVIGPAFSLLPLLVTEHFAGDALQLGWLQSALGVGTLSGGFLLSVWGGFRRKMVTSLVGLATLGAGSAWLGLVPGTLFPLAIAAMLILGIGLPITNGPIVATLQAVVPPEKQGRVFALVSSLSAGIMPIGLLLAGPLADLIGVRTWILVAGFLVMLATIWAARQQDLLALDQVQPFDTVSMPDQSLDLDVPHPHAGSIEGDRIAPMETTS
jgi:DHA3 family macrolide efflux protein-like MFS transporter